MKQQTGVIDIGSNTIRLVIYEHSESRYEEVENIKIPARLREYFDDSQSLNKEGIETIIRALQLFQTVIQQYRVPEVICTATAAIRQAANKKDILQIIKEKTGFITQLLSDREEAYYGFLGSVHSTYINEGVTIDMGGGSTEVTYFRNQELIHYHSFPFGSLSLKLNFVKGCLPTEQEKENIRSFIRSQLTSLSWITDKELPIVALGGSARNIAQIHHNLIDYPLAGIHQYEMSAADVQAVKKSLQPLSYDDLQKVEGLSKDRTDTILPALEVFSVLFEVVSATKLVFSSQGLRDGIIYESLNRPDQKTDDSADDGIQELLKELHLPMHAKTQEIKLAVSLFKQVREHAEEVNKRENDLRLLTHGTETFFLGKRINEESSRTAFYLLSNRNIARLSHRDRIQLALIASYKGKSAFRQYILPFKNWFSKAEQKTLCIMGAVIKLAYKLNVSGKNGVLDIHVSPNKDDWIVYITCKHPCPAEEYHFLKEKKHLEKLLKVNIVPKFKLV